MTLRLDDELLFKRHCGLPRLPQIHVEFTRDPALLHQYYALRSLNLADSPKKLRMIESTENDNRAKIIVVRNGSQVVGGGRVIIRNAEKDNPLSIEHPEMPLAALLKEFNLEKKSYAEISKVFLLEEFSDDSMLENFYQCVANNLLENGVMYAFSTCNLPLPEQSSLTATYQMKTLNPQQAFDHQMARRFYQRLAVMDCSTQQSTTTKASNKSRVLQS